MATSTNYIIKRDGKKEVFSPLKIQNALNKAFIATGVDTQLTTTAQITDKIVNNINKEVVSVEEIQDLVENELMKTPLEVA